MRDEVTRAAFKLAVLAVLAALGVNTQFELDLVKTRPRTRVADDFAVGNSAADTAEHCLACWWKSW